MLYLTKDVWPEFRSRVLAVHGDIVRSRRPEVQRLVDGIARSGMWLDVDKNSNNKYQHRMQVAKFVGQHYYHQDPKLLDFVLSSRPATIREVIAINIPRPRKIDHPDYARTRAKIFAAMAE